MGISHCRVSYLDQEGLDHAVEVEAESLYEAVAIAVAEFRQAGGRKAIRRVGVPQDACVTGTIQTIRQETRQERRRNPAFPPYRASIALREFVHYQGIIRLAFDLKHCPPEFIALLLEVAPAINYLGKRGSFVQYLSGAWRDALDSSFTQPVDDSKANLSPEGHRTALDDFGTRASFAALNSFASTPVRRDIERRFVETIIPLNLYNSGPGFVHYSAPGKE
jgi:hypothetical protein